MNGATPDKKRTLREVYRNSSERVSLALTLFGSVKQDSLFALQPEKDFDAIANLLKNVVESQKIEDENEYRVLILDVGNWLLKGYQREYLIANKGNALNVMYVVRRGIEVLHLLLHRDLRRRALSPTESQLYHEFRQLCLKIPDPRKTGNLDTDDVEFSMSTKIRKSS